MWCRIKLTRWCPPLPCFLMCLPTASSLLTSREVFKKYQRIRRNSRMIPGSGIKMYGLAADATMMMAMNRSISYREVILVSGHILFLNITTKYSRKVCGSKSSRKPTSLENLFNTRPAVDGTGEHIFMHNTVTLSVHLSVCLLSICLSVCLPMSTYH